MNDRLLRAEAVLGPEAMARLRESRVAVLGLGGVGSWCAEALARTGVGALTVMDEDSVCETNINRQAIALHSTVGRPKAEVMAERIRDIAPDCAVTAIVGRYDAENRERFFSCRCDYIADAIDLVACKLDLICSAMERGIPIISALGTGNKLDASLLRVCDISKTEGDGLARVVKTGKARYIGIANCYAWQLAKANALAEKEGFPKFVSVQNHYNLLFREEEREMDELCEEDNIAMTPYSALASGRLSRKPGETTKRMEEDSVAKSKYNGMAAADEKIIARVAEMADKYGVTMTEIALSWLLTKVTAPVVGATKPHHVDGAVKAIDLTLSEEDKNYLEELYVPHPLVGVMAQNTKSAAKKEKEWMKHSHK